MALKHILVVDDEKAMLKVAQLALGRIGGFDVTLASSGPEAIASATQERPDLVMLDLMMPEMDGRQTLAALRKVPGCADIPVVVASAAADAADVSSMKGVVGVVAKPYRPTQLPAELKRLYDLAME